MAELTEAMQSYAALDKKLKELELEKKVWRVQVLQEFKDNPDTKYNGMTFTESEKITFNDDMFFAWVAREFPDQVENCKADRIDYEKFEGLYSAGKIKYDSIPKEVYNTTEVLTLRVTKIK